MKPRTGRDAGIAQLAAAVVASAAAAQGSTRCDWGGMYFFPGLSGPAVLQPRCTQPPAHRWRADGMAEGHWSHRCAEHARVLSAPGLVIEPPLTEDREDEAR